MISLTFLMTTLCFLQLSIHHISAIIDLYKFVTTIKTPLLLVNV